MARLCPTLPPRSVMSAGDHAEIELLGTLERGLPDAYTLFHSVDWSRGTGSQEQHGEIDIVVVNQRGDLMLIEVKAGDVAFLPNGIFKTYGNQVRDVTSQIRLQYNALRTRLSDAGLAVHVNHLLVLPHLKVKTETVQWPRERIVDSNDVVNIVSRITQVLEPGQHEAGILERVLAFLQDHFQVETDVTALSGHLQQSATRLASGLATWVPRIEVPSGVIRVIGTAGSGKTQLALRLLRDADASGKKAAYVCFNRTLADHIARVAPVRTPAETFHQFALRVVRGTGVQVNFGLPNAFDTLANLCADAITHRDPDLDLLVIDEMQDMQPEWVQTLLSRLRVDGRAVLLEDPEQQLYKDRQPFDIPDAVKVTSYENFRTPRTLVNLINMLRLTEKQVDAKSPVEGDLPDPIVYETSERIAPCTSIAVERCLKRGFDLPDIAVISMRGRDGSVLQDIEKLGPWSIRRFTGAFDEGSEPIWTDGELLLDSIRRFKGQAAPAVVLTECDFTTLEQLNRRLLFVGLTRARLHLEWVISANTANMLKQALGA